MGSGTYFIGPAAEAATAAPTTCGDDGLRSVQWRTDATDSLISRQETQFASRQRSSRRLGREWLTGLFVLILVNCAELVCGGQYAIIEAVQQSPQPSLSKVAMDLHERAPELSESEMQRIQDLVLRGLNITRIPRASEVSLGCEIR